MNVNLKEIPAKVAEFLGKVGKYAVVLFILLLAIVYGFLIMRINSMQSAPPSSVSGTQNVTTVATPRIDPKIVQQLQQLQDNSVSVKTLFDQARSNPFQE